MQSFVQIRNNCLVVYQLPTCRPARGHRVKAGKAYSGKVTSGAAKRLKSAIDILIQQTPVRTTWNPVTKKHFPFQINFITLTVSDQKNIDAKFGFKNLLEPFLRKMRNRGKVSYVWKLELQQRGQVHYHIATDTFQPWTDIRNDWNNLQRKNRLLDNYALQHGHFNANSTDVHALYQVKDVGAYMSKYLSKTNSAKVNGKVWDCSQDLKRPRFTFTPTGNQELLLRQIQKDRQANVLELEHCTIFKMPKPQRILTAQQSVDYINWLS